MDFHEFLEALCRCAHKKYLENEKLDLEREAAQRLLSEMEDAGAQKEAELSALAEENQSLSQVWHARDETDIIKFLVAVF